MRIKIEPSQINVSIKTERVYPELEDITVKATTKEQKFKSEKYGYNEITVLPKTVELQDKEITKNGEYTPDEGYDGLGKVTVQTSGVDINDYFENKIDDKYGRAVAHIKRMPPIDISENMPGYYNAMFNGFLSLEEVPTPLDVSKATDLSSFFAQCRTLKKIPPLNTSNSTNFRDMFNQCYELEEIPLIDTSKGTSFGYMFYSCSKIKTIPTLNMTNAQYLFSMFNSCTLLENVPFIDISNAVDISSMFKNCNNLSNESLNNILQMCITATKIKSANKTLKYIGLSSAQADICKNLSNYQNFLDSGWVTGY